MARILRVGRYDLDTQHHTLHGEDAAIQLSPQACKLLQVLAMRPGEVLDRSYIIEQLWRGDRAVGAAALTRLVKEVSSAMGEGKDGTALIQAVPRRGYRLVTAADAPLHERVGWRGGALRIAAAIALTMLATLAVAVVMAAQGPR